MNLVGLGELSGKNPVTFPYVGEDGGPGVTGNISRACKQKLTL